MKNRHRIFQVVCGDVIGVIDEPSALDPKTPLAEQWIVRIGTLRRYPRMRRPVEAEIEKVVIALREFLRRERHAEATPEAIKRN